MTTLEVVEAVQRSLENEGFLQSIRAQLRSNVLRIISSGPDYVPSQGKVVEFSGRRSGALSLHLVRDLLSTLGLKESLSVFEAESGIERHSTIDRDAVLAELHIQCIQDFCLLECLVLNTTTAERTNDYHDAAQGKQYAAQLASSSKESKDNADEYKEKANEKNISLNRSLDQSASFAEEEAEEEVGSVEEEIEEPEFVDEDFSQLEDKDDEAKSPQAPPRVEAGSKHTPVDSPVRPSFGLTSSGRLDESSSFEADSPAKVQMQADFKQTAVLTNRDHKATAAADVDDSFAEDSVQDSVPEEVDESIASDADEQDKKAESRERDESSQQGPEYDSDSHSSHHSDYKREHKGSSSPLPPVSVAAKSLAAAAAAEDKHSALSPDVSRDEQDLPATEDASSPEVEVEVALARATAEDFDRVDRSGVDQDMAARRTNARNRVAVQRAGQPAEGKGADDDSAGAKASVFRLGQSSISRSTLGWGNSTNANNMDTSASFEEDVRSDEDEGKGYAPTRGSVGRTGTGSAGARYSSTSQMEAVSFESTDNERSPSKAAAAPPQRRSNNQEESEGEASAGEQDFSDFEADEQDEQSSNLQSPRRKDVAASRGAAFASPTKSERSEQDQDASAAEDEEEEEEYADEGFDEDFEEADEEAGNHQHSDSESGGSPARPAPGPARAFAAAAGAGTGSGYNPTLRGSLGQQVGGKGSSNNQQDDDSEAEEVESIVEEDIPEEDEFSVGDQDSDEEGSDGGFNDAARKKPAASIFTPSTGMSRAGRSGALPGVKAPAAAARGSNFDALLNNSDTSEEERPLPSKASAGSRSDKSQTGITARMQEIDSQLEEMERDDSGGNLAQLRKAHEQQQSAHGDDSSVASEDIDAMEFSTGGGGDEDSESSGEGSFSFLDSSSKK